MRASRVALGIAAALALLGPPSAQAAFGIERFEAAATLAGGAPASLAGSHPHSLRAEVAFAPGGGEDLRELRLELPSGLIENPLAAPVCSQADFAKPRGAPSASGESCPVASQLGTIAIHTDAEPGGVRHFGLFNLAPPPGAPSRLGAAPFGAPLIFTSALRQGGGEYGLTLIARNVTQHFDIEAIGLELWGTPWQSAHNGLRGSCLNESDPGAPHGACAVDIAKQPFGPRAYLTLPSQCSEPPAFGAAARSWQAPATTVEAESTLAALTDCEGLGFGFGASALPSTAVASSPTGLSFRLSTSQSGLLGSAQRLASRPRRARIELAAGITINPAVGSGLGACSAAQFAAEGPGSAPGAGCPNQAKVGELRLATPLLAEELAGAIYIATPYANPFATPLALYLIARSPQRGIAVKIAGRLDADPATGKLTASFEDLPQLPYTNLRADFREGQRAPLSSPERCGNHTSRIELAPWSDPSLTHVEFSSFPIARGLGAGGACPSAAKPFAPGALAGSLNPDSGSATPFYLRLTRRDSEQEITSYSALLPRGVTASLAGVELCSEQALAGAASRSGLAEAASPSCPPSSQIGRTFVGYGVGLAPAYAPGRMFLAGPYRGSELSLATVNAAVVGPFDLGVVVVRSALRIDPVTARLAIDSAASDPIPHILEGIPLRLRDIRAHIDRPGFARNPTSCAASEVISTLGGSGQRFSDPADDTSATVSTHFQLSNCSARGFSPALSLRLRGKTRRGAYPALRATFAPRPGDANARSVQVTLPPTAFLAQEHIGTVCTRERFATSNCPPGSLYGSAVAHTPLLDAPLRGGAYLRSSTNRLPDLVFDLRSGPIRIVVSGRIDSVGEGRIRASFEDLPDAPLDRFVLNMFGAKRGLISNAANVCKARGRALGRAVAQNNRGRVLRVAVGARCGPTS